MEIEKEDKQEVPNVLNDFALFVCNKTYFTTISLTIN